MRKAILILACLFLFAPSVNSQRKHPQSKAKPKPEDDLAAGVVIPKDEVLFEKLDYEILKYRTGWRLVGFSDEDSGKIQTLAYYDPERIIVVRTGL
jgi:hypothetical protein